mmetsp:Transcript_3445/g.6585  ORF Transcript_3445/g.6585 Transcript_3445/m.6585 type:complete len:172 (-) Transcript_3445:1552-2067(-)|eukprot:scaffold11998_cov174-Amphora_coffeaeformis.AAC.6
MEICNELNTPILDVSDTKTDESTYSPQEKEKSDQRTGVIVRNSIGALLIFNFATSYYLEEDSVCPVVLAFVSLEGPIFFLVMASLYGQTCSDANAKSSIVLALPEIMTNLVNVLLVLQYIDEARLAIFTFTLVLAFFVVFGTAKQMLWGAAPRNDDDSKTECKSLTECQIV